MLLPPPAPEEPGRTDGCAELQLAYQATTWTFGAAESAFTDPDAEDVPCGCGKLPVRVCGPEDSGRGETPCLGGASRRVGRRCSARVRHGTTVALLVWTMVEIEWDGVELASEARRSVLDRLRGLAVLVDPDGRARLQVEIVREPSGFSVVVAGGDELRWMGAEVRDRDLMRAVQRAIDLTLSRWRAARERAA